MKTPMTSTGKTIDHATLEKLVDAGVVRGVDVIGHAGGWAVVVKYGMTERALAARRGDVRRFGRFETLVAYLRGMGISQCHVNAADFDPDEKLRVRPDSAERMRKLFAVRAAIDTNKKAAKRPTARGSKQ